MLTLYCTSNRNGSRTSRRLGANCTCNSKNQLKYKTIFVLHLIGMDPEPPEDWEPTVHATAKTFLAKRQNFFGKVEN